MGNARPAVLSAGPRRNLVYPVLRLPKKLKIHGYRLYSDAAVSSQEHNNHQWPASGFMMPARSDQTGIQGHLDLATPPYDTAGSGACNASPSSRAEA